MKRPIKIQYKQVSGFSLIFDLLFQVFYILSHLNKTGKESCELLNLCSSSSLSNSKAGSVEHKWEISEQFTDLFRKMHHSIPGLPGHRTRKEVNRQNVIRIAHLTDIHVEEEYVEVNRTDLTKCIQPPRLCPSFFVRPGQVSIARNYCSIKVHHRYPSLMCTLSSILILSKTHREVPHNVICMFVVETKVATMEVQHIHMEITTVIFHPKLLRNSWITLPLSILI